MYVYITLHHTRLNPKLQFTTISLTPQGLRTRPAGRQGEEREATPEEDLPAVVGVPRPTPHPLRGSMHIYLMNKYSLNWRV